MLENKNNELELNAKSILQKLYEGETVNLTDNNGTLHTFTLEDYRKLQLIGAAIRHSAITMAEKLSIVKEKKLYLLMGLDSFKDYASHIGIFSYQYCNTLADIGNQIRGLPNMQLIEDVSPKKLQKFFKEANKKTIAELKESLSTGDQGKVKEILDAEIRDLKDKNKELSENVKAKENIIVSGQSNVNELHKELQEQKNHYERIIDAMAKDKGIDSARYTEITTKKQAIETITSFEHTLNQLNSLVASIPDEYHNDVELATMLVGTSAMLAKMHNDIADNWVDSFVRLGEDITP